MAAQVTVWTEERIAEVKRRLGAGETPFTIAVAMQRTEAAIRSLLRDRGRFGERAPASAGVSVSRIENAEKVDEREPLIREPAPPLALDWTGARPRSSGEGLERRLVFSDTHFPFHSMQGLRGLLALAKAIQPHVILHLGDVFNMGAVSLHPRPYGGRESHLAAMGIGASFFRALRKASPGSRIYILAGNHDDWAEEHEDRAPETAGLFAAQRYLELAKIAATWVPREMQPLVLGPVAYAHGTGGGEHYSKRYALHDAPRAGVRHFRVGHHHRVTRYHAKNGCECFSVPWLGDPRHSAFDYAPDKGDWEVGALVDDVWGERVTSTPVRLDGGVALFGGRMVRAA
jgi:predicted phosphodiesterase